MHRRDFICLLGGTVVCFPTIADAQQARLPIIGFLGSETSQLWTERVTAFLQGLKEAGFTEGQNVSIRYRWAEGHNDRLPTLAAELIQQQVSMLVVLGGTASAMAAKGTTTTIPVVFRIAVDPVESGLVASLSPPGGNITGITTMGAELGSKQLELLHELVSTATAVALLINP